MPDNIDLVFDEANKKPADLAWAKQYAAEKQLTIVEKNYNALVAFALALAERDIKMTSKMSFYTGAGVAIPLSVTVNLGQGDTLQRATIKAVFESLATFGGAAALAALGAGPVTVGFGSVLVGYAAVEIAHDLIDRYVGVSATFIKDEERKRYEFKVGNGKFSDFLRPRGNIAEFFDGLFGAEANVWREFNLVDAEHWKLKHANTSEESLKIEYFKDAGFIFTGAASPNLNELYRDTEEHTEVVKIILEQYDRDFNAKVGGTTNFITNYFNKTASQLESGAKNNDEKILSALEHLTPFHEKSVELTADTSEWSNQYIKDRAKFVYAEAHGNEDNIRFYDKKLKLTVEPGAGSSSLTYTANYTFGSSGGDTFGLNMMNHRGRDHLYGMAGNDTLYGRGGEDRLEGGKGQDTMYGGDGCQMTEVVP